MDFGSLLHVAQANEYRAKKEPTKCYRTSFSPPKKENKNKTLSVNIKKFLARKEEEEKQKELQDKKKRDGLLALRSQDGKAKKRVAAMLKRTKAANKAAIEDAVDDDNTAVTINGPSQPDEDDYGYVSQEASAYYNKLMDKYNSAPPEEPLFSNSKKTVHHDLNSTKDRVRMALLREEEEEIMPHKRKRKSKNKKEDDPGDATLNYSSSDLRDLATEDVEPEPQKVPAKPKAKRPAPPPMDFCDLLKLAEKKQFEPIKIEPKRKSEDEEERPMTKKQKQEYMKELEWRKRKEEAARVGRDSSTSNHSFQRIPKLSNKDDQDQTSTQEKSQGKQIASGSQMRIPKLNSAMREDRLNNLKTDESLNNGRREEKLSAQKFSRPNGSHGQDSSNNNATKSIASVREGNVLKHSKSNEVMTKMSKMDTSNLSSKSSREEYVDRSKIVKNVTSTEKQFSSMGSEGKQLNDGGVSMKKSATVSGYDKKLQDAIMAKMEEAKRNAELKKKMSTPQNVSAKIAGKSFGGRDELVNTRDSERTAPNVKIGKYSKPENSSEANYKQSSMKPSQEISRSVPQNKSKSVPSAKFKDLPSDSKSKSMPLTPKLPITSEKVRKVMQPDPNRRPMTTSEVRPKQMPPSSFKQLQSSNIKSKQIPANTKSEKIPHADAKPRQLPPSDAKPRQLPPSDAKPRQLLPSDAKPRQIPPSDAKHRQISPSDAKPRQLPPNGSAKPRQLPPSDAKSRQLPPSDAKPRQLPPSDAKPRQLPPSDAKPRQLPPSDAKPRQFPPADVKPRQFPPGDLKPRQFPPMDVQKKPKLPVKRRITDSDEEYDSEMDDFIDDGPQDEEDVSKHIREIFGYDKRKYSRIDDDECMESNYASILKEEFISTKTGILEDLEDIRREKEMEKRKKAMKKRRL